nr:hypothetical protein [Georgenia sp. EYE_87]
MAEILPTYFVELRADLGRGTFIDDLATYHDIRSICDLEREVDMLLDKQKPTTRRIDNLPEDREEARDDNWRKAEAHLVDHKHPRPKDQCTSKREHLLLTT